jgi:hypothetical protein
VRHFCLWNHRQYFFFTDRLNDKIWYYRQKVSRQMFFINDLVGKKITDKLWITDRWNLSAWNLVVMSFMPRNTFCHSFQASIAIFHRKPPFCYVCSPVW